MVWKVGGCFNGRTVLNEGAVQRLTLPSPPRVVSASFCMTSGPMLPLWVVWQLELGAWR